MLLGPSGSGKIHTFNIIGGIDSPDSGYISINGGKDRGHGREDIDKIQESISDMCFRCTI